MTRRKSPAADREPPDDDGELFRRAVADATPLERDFVNPERPRPAARARFSRRDDRAVLAESLAADIDDTELAAGERLHFRRPEVGRRTLKRLARGRYGVQDELDLHGMTLSEAEGALREFLERSLMLGHRCVRIVHGKGLGSGTAGPVLKPGVHRWLRRCRKVLAFTAARQVDGGTGAVYVLLDDG